TFEPRSRAKIPLSTPTIAVAWVRFGKYPSRRSTALPGVAALPDAHAARISPKARMTATRDDDVFIRSINENLRGGGAPAHLVARRPLRCVGCLSALIRFLLWPRCKHR